MCGRFIPSVPFYLRRRIPTVNVKTYARFEREEEIRKYSHWGLNVLEDFLRSKSRIFCIIKAEELKELDKKYYTVLTEVPGKNLFLITNLPPEGTSPD